MTVRTRKFKKGEDESEGNYVVVKETDKDLKEFDEKVDIGKKVIGSSSDRFSFVELMMFTIFVAPLTSHAVATTVNVFPKFLEPLLGNFFPHQFYFRACFAALLLGLSLGIYYRDQFVSLLSVKLGQIGLLFSVSHIYLFYMHQSAEDIGPFYSSHLAYLAPVYLPIVNAAWLNCSLFLHHLSFFKLEDTKLHAITLISVHFASIVLGVGLTTNWPQFLTFFESSCINFMLTSLACGFVTLFLNFTLLQTYRPNMYDKVVMPTLIFFVVTFTLTRIPQCTPELKESHYNTSYGINVLARNESRTGWVSVFEDNKNKVRVLRSGHSILGGKFLEYGDSMFPSFYFMEMVNMVKGKRSSPPKALQIGLGVGISAQYLIKDGVAVDIVEIDPVVVDYAEQYFGLVRPKNVFIEDGRQFLEKVQPGAYDYILHDVFSGGTVPKSLFSVEALQMCKHALQPNGVLALNYVGGIVFPYNFTFSTVVTTLKQVFPHVRLIAETEDFNRPDGLINLVFYASSTPIEFGPAPFIEDQQSTRYRILNSYSKYEVPLNKYLGKNANPLTDRENHLDRLQRLSAEVHWYKMRQLFPTQLWVNY